MGNPRKPRAKKVVNYNVSLTSADTEYSQLLDNDTVSIALRCRTANDIRYAWVTGKVATPTAPYSTLGAGKEYYETEVNLRAKTLYLASGDGSVVAELEVGVT